MITILVFIIICIITTLTTIVRVQSYKKYIYNIEGIPKEYDVIIVLGAGVRVDGTPSDILADRLETSVDVYSKGMDKILLLSGDHEEDGYNEVRVMKDYVMKYNLDEKRIFMDHAGFSTYDTMYRAKKIFKVNKAVIVTNEYHLPRAIYIARKLGIDAYGVASDIREYELMDKYRERELLAQLKDFIYVNILKPKPKFLGEAIPINNSDGRITDDNK
ncbi:vancomycin high temperature exclusion protein [Clostridium sp. MB05]|jgi:SanA protein|nr:ElyC/SanA/YdcF family protein [Clostridium perfringens]